MHVIRVMPNDNGSHDQQTCNMPFDILDGYALVPENIEIPSTYPFVFLEVEDGVVTSMTPNMEAYEAAMKKRDEESTLSVPTEENELFVSALVD